jgi:hypothetical protein
MARWRIGIIANAAIVVAPFALMPPSASALTLSLLFDSSTSNAPPAFFTAVDTAAQFFETNFSDPITINIHVGWGSIDGENLDTDDIGQSKTNQQGSFTYSQIETDLINDAKSSADATAIANLPATYSGNFFMSDAEAKALKILAPASPEIDGYVGFSSSVPFTFDPLNRAVPGEYDFIGLAEHEISEVMGRYGLGQNGASSGRYSPIDLFRYTAPGVLDTVPENGAYFSIDGGNTVINTFNGTNGGDLADWAGYTPDAFNDAYFEGIEEPVTPGDLTVMDVIGYDPALPEPASITFIGLGIGGLLRARRRPV